jgi:hypothetical protein
MSNGCTSWRCFTKVFSKTTIVFSYSVHLRSTATQNAQHNHTHLNFTRHVLLLHGFMVVLPRNALILVCFTKTKHVCFGMIILDCPYALFKRFCTSWILTFGLPNISMWNYLGDFLWIFCTPVLHVLHVVFAWTSRNRCLYFLTNDEIILFFSTFGF